MLKQWALQSQLPQATDPQDMMRFNEAIDQALAESMAQFSWTLQAGEAKFRTMTDAMPQMVWSTLPDGEHDYYNRQWYEFTGVPEGSTDGEGWNDMFHPEDQARAWEVWRHSLRTGDDYEIQYRLRHHSGSYRWTLGRALPMRSESGQILRWMGTCTDIHAQKIAEEDLRQVDQRRNEFLAMLAHELRNPLAPINTAAGILRLDGIDSKTVHLTSSIITRQVRHMTGLVDDLLDVSRVTRGLVTLNLETLDLRHVLDAAIEQARPMIDARKLELTVRMVAAGVYVQGDRLRLSQIVANLLNNATKYTPDHGRIVLSLEVRGTDAVVTVADKGVGIDSKLLPHIYDLFTQGERSSDRSQGGLGVGLSLVKSLVGFHLGKVEATSAPGKGSIFTVVLPLKSRSAPGSAHADAPAEQRVEPLRIVLVDDNKDAAEVLAILLGASGHDVTVRHDGKSTLALDPTLAPQVFILDVGLPDLDGYELARRLRQLPASSAATFIALTGYGQLEDRAKSKQAGFDHHFVKPVDGEKLNLLLQQLV